MQELVSPASAEKLLFNWATQFSSHREVISVALDSLDVREVYALAEEVYCDRDLPPYDRVMMDGVVVRADDWVAGIRKYQLGGTQAAGQCAVLDVANGQAVEVMTGAVCPLPPHEVVIIPVEYLEGGLGDIGGEILVNEAGGLGVPLETGKWIHKAGSDRKEGEILAKVGQAVTPAVMGVLASCGYAEVLVFRPLRVAIISTGDELVALDETPAAHQIRRSNDQVMRSFVESLGGEVCFFASVDDERENVCFVLEKARKEAELILFSGGASKGRRDWIPEVLSDEFGAPLFHGVSQRPGKPFGAWAGEGKLALAFPGNPVSVLSCLCRYLGPLMRQFSGRAVKQVKVLATNVHAPRGLTMLQAVSLNDEDRAEPVMTNTSGDFAGLAELAGFVEVENQAEAGDEVVFYPLG